MRSGCPLPTAQPPPSPCTGEGNNGRGYCCVARGWGVDWAEGLTLFLTLGIIIL